MPLPRWLARVNLHFTNHLLGPLAKRLPGWGVVIHTGRKTHRQYRTPVFVFASGNKCIIALTYGRESHWVRNVLAQGGCELETQRRTLKLTHPRLFHYESRAAVPAPHRTFLAAFRVSDFLEFAVASEI